MTRDLDHEASSGEAAFSKLCSQLILDLDSQNGQDDWDRRASEIETFRAEHADHVLNNYLLRLKLARLAALVHNEAAGALQDAPAQLRALACELVDAATWTEAQLELLSDQMVWDYETVDPVLLEGHKPTIDFVPEAWQWEMIQAADRDVSMLVTAPTSSGKTFIASYIIRKVSELKRVPV